MSAAPEPLDREDGAIAREALRPFLTDRGVINILAVDHRDAMRNAYARLGVRDVTEAEMLATKARILDILAPAVSGVLADARAASLPRPPGLGLFMPLEEQGYDTVDGGRLNRLMSDFTPADGPGLGADGCKLLLYYRADHEPTARLQLGLTVNAATVCHRHGLALVVEPKVYRLVDEDEDAYRSRFGELVVASGRDLATSGADLIKLQYPGTQELCAEVTAATSPVPWALLGGEIESDTFASELEDACRGGASGFIAGRAIWGGALGLRPGAQTTWLEQTALPLLQRLCNITEARARRIV